MTQPQTSGRAALAGLLVIVGVASTYFAIDYFRDSIGAEGKQTIVAGKAIPPVSTELEGQEHAAASPDVIPDESALSVGVSRKEPGPEAFRPFKLYSRYIDEAEHGNLTAQYVLATALDECRRGPSTAEEIVELEKSVIADEILQAVKDRFQRCKPLRDALPNLESEYERWYQAARNGQHPLILVKKRNIPIDEKRRRIINAISQSYPEPYLYARAYMEAAILHRIYPEKIDILRDEAWLLMYCEASLHCNSQKEREYLRTKKYHAHEYKQIAAIQTSIAAAIKRRDWSALGL